MAPVVGEKAGRKPRTFPRLRRECRGAAEDGGDAVLVREDRGVVDGVMALWSVPGER
ncbi:hypothetical protein [Desulfobotulus sp.]|uniref:hypothetical protein n=1 Tax=Desulfobotulus sp. TaxID=1940337 RepID=UPI002A3620C0|nr:hypothetical protein [Desulfobotulus sp.]MDY0162569.1 hypothetical protein [Desulfobotulus sp.]